MHLLLFLAVLFSLPDDLEQPVSFELLAKVRIIVFAVTMVIEDSTVCEPGWLHNMRLKTSNNIHLLACVSLDGCLFAVFDDPSEAFEGADEVPRRN